MPSLSRTYRPQRFVDITDQQPIKDTLRLAAAGNKLGHAYLFAGPRGTGKTTAARVFAKALNCLHPTDGEPCNTCEACTEINSNRALDVIEMDAASNTGVDNVREAIIEHVRFVPHRKHKIYILDEAHMLSTSAWNALLKTIEEPPPYAVFILITTELHKVPQTIQSRCQRFDFKRVSNEALAERINFLARQEKVRLAPEVVITLLARSDGCVRDAEILLDQLIGLGEPDITSDIASLVLPISRLPLAADLLKCWSQRELGAALSAIADLEQQGIPLMSFFDDLIQAVRYLLLASDSVEWRHKLAHGDVGENTLAGLVTAFEPMELSEMALMLMERRRDAKQGADARFCLELAASAVSLGALPHGSSGFNAAAHARSTSIPDNPNTQATNLNSEVAQAKITQPDDAPTISLASIQQKWPSILRAVEDKSRSLTFIMKLAHPASFDGKLLLIQFQYPFHRDKIISDIKTKHMVEDCIRTVTGSHDLHIDGVVTVADAVDKEPHSQDVVSNILKAFGGQLIPILVIASLSLFGLGCQKKSATSATSTTKLLQPMTVTPSNQGVLTLPPASAPDSNVNTELSDSLNSFRALKSFRVKFTMVTPQGRLKANLEFVKPNRFRGVLEVGQASKTEIIAVDDSLYLRANNSQWANLSNTQAAQALRASLKQALSGDTSLDKIKLDETALVKKSRDEARQCDLYKTTTRNATSNTTVIEVCAVNGWPKYVSIQGDTHPIEFEYYDYNKVFLIERPV